MIRRRPIPRSHDYPTESLRYTTILNGAVRVYKDGKEFKTQHEIDAKAKVREALGDAGDEDAA